MSSVSLHVIDTDIVEAEYVITPEMISVVVDRIEIMMIQNTVIGQPEDRKRVEINPREFAKFFNQPVSLMREILIEIYKNPPDRINKHISARW